jgi:Family of unknown function (DUF6455)
MSMTSTLHPHPNNQDVKHHVVADFGSGAFDLLLTRMEALQLEPDEVRRIESSVFADLAGACVKCESKDSCEQDLRSAGAVEHDWESYCPNAATLSALAALPWFGKARTKVTS